MQTTENQADPFYIIVVVFLSFVALIPVHFGQFGDPYTWETNFFSNVTFAKAVLTGNYPVWISNLGFGMPFPMSPNQIHHPLVLLFGLIGPALAVSLFYQFQLGVGSIAFWFLCRHYQVSRSVAIVCVATYLSCSTTVDWTFIKFTSSELFYWSMVPVAFLLAAKLIDHSCNDRRTFIGLSLGFGLTLGIIVLNSHPNLPSVLFVLLAVFLVPQWRAALIRRHGFLLAGAVALLISGPKLFMIFNEFILFPDGLIRNSGRLSENRDWLRVSLPHSLFFLPLFKTNIIEVAQALMNLELSRAIEILTRDYFAGGTGARLEFRDVFMGPPFALLAFSAPFLAIALNDRKLLFLSCISLFSFALIFLVPDFILYLIGRDVFFRDGVILFGTLSAGLVLTRWFGERKRTLRMSARCFIVLQLVALTGALAPTWVSSLTQQLPQQPERTMPLSVSDYWGMFSSINWVKDIVGESEARVLVGNCCDGSEWGRNVPAYNGIRQVQATARAIYLGDIAPVTGAIMDGNIYFDNTVFMNGRLLDVLGIRYVIVGEGTTVARDLEFLENLILQTGETVKIFENKDVWPETVVLDRKVTDKAFGQFPSCMHTRLLCRDFRGIESFRKKDARASLQRQGNVMEVSLANYEAGDLLFVSEMYRQYWTASSNHRRLEVEKTFGGLIGITLPAEATKIRFRYVPTMLYGSIGVSYLAIILSLAGIVFLMRRGDR